MGSGETSPTMVTAHQQCLKDVDPTRAVFLDTPFGFQENADDLTEKIVSYFSQNVGTDITHLKLRSTKEVADQVARVHAKVADAQWVFTGPGSPSYTVKTWQQVGLVSAFEKMLEHGTLVAASAAALTIGYQTIPVYEIYKVGEDPYWLSGMNLLERVTGFRAVVVPHFNNNEGANHDTRFCYMGERRMSQLEAALPEDVFVLGVDEHTGVRFDLECETVEVFGKGGMTLRRGTTSVWFESGTELTYDQIADAISVPRAIQEAVLIEEDLDIFATDFAVLTRALIGKLQDAATPEILAGIARLGEQAATPKVDEAEILRPLVTAVLNARDTARAEKRWDDSDRLRDLLLQVGVEIQDTPQGSSWVLKSE
jgi:peptidase E